MFFSPSTFLRWKKEGKAMHLFSISHIVSEADAQLRWSWIIVWIWRLSHQFLHVIYVWFMFESSSFMIFLSSHNCSNNFQYVSDALSKNINCFRNILFGKHFIYDFEDQFAINWSTMWSILIIMELSINILIILDLRYYYFGS